MRRLTLTLLMAALFIAFPASVRAQSGLLSITFTAPLAGGGINLLSTGVTFHKLTWNVQGTAATCTVALDSAPDGVTWTAGGAIAGQTCTSNGSSAVTAGTFNFVRINATALTCTGTCSVTVTWTGYINNPGGGGSGTVNNSTGAANAYYAGAGTAVSGDTSIVDNGSGAVTFSAGVTHITSTQGTLATSNPFMSHTATWNAGAVAFTDWLSNITCTAAATASIAAGWGTSGTQWQMKYGAANCASPQFLMPTGTPSIPDFASSTNTTTGMWFPSTAGLTCFTTANSDTGCQSNGFIASLGSVFKWTNGLASSGTIDTGISRSAANVIAFGNGAASNTTASLKAAAYMSVGTTFTSNAGCAETTLTGGATAGKYTSVTAGTCTVVITMGNAATAPNGWSCTATDLTTAANVGNIHQSATTTTTASLLEGTVAANDVIQFSCIGY